MKTQVQNITANYEVIFSPSDKQFGEIEKWLIDEEIKAGKGFYCNWKFIKSSFDNNELATISFNNTTIGFVTWRITTDKTARIEIAEIRPSHRKKGIGKKLIDHLIEFLKTKNIVVVDLQCAPADSEPIWKRLGFVEFPDPPERYKFNSDGNKKLYKILTDHLRRSSVRRNDETIELWNNEPYRTIEITPPTYIWNLEFTNSTRKLSKPIIQPASYEWRIRWSKNEKTIEDEKVKRFTTEIDFNSFIIIEELPNC